MGVLIGLARKCGFMRPDGEIRNLDKAFITDSIGTMFSACMGTTTATSYLESASGVAAGGRTGLTAVTTAGCFVLALFFIPLVGVVPAYATAPILIIVGALMMQEVVHIRFERLEIAIPAFLTIMTMPFTFNIATGFGFELHGHPRADGSLARGHALHVPDLRLLCSELHHENLIPISRPLGTNPRLCQMRSGPDGRPSA